MQPDNPPKYQASNTLSYIMLTLMVAALWLAIVEVNVGWFAASVFMFVAFTYERNYVRGVRLLNVIFKDEK